MYISYKMTLKVVQKLLGFTSKFYNSLICLKLIVINPEG